MIVNILKNGTFLNEANLPKRGTPGSTGYDILAASHPRIVSKEDPVDGYYDSIDYFEYSTDIFIEVEPRIVDMGAAVLEEHFDSLVFPRSGVSKRNLMFANCIGLVDEDYRGEILVRFNYIWQPRDLKYVDSAEYTGLVGKPNLAHLYALGDAIAQFKFTRNEPVELRLVDSISDTVRGTGGWGSTDSPKVLPGVNEVSTKMSSIAELYNKTASGSEPTPPTYSEQVRERELQ